MSERERSPFVEQAIDVITIGVMVAAALFAAGLLGIGVVWIAERVL